jgi:pre-mRNA-processing factor 6
MSSNRFAIQTFSSHLVSASGFTTRSDIGPAREGPSAEAIAEAQARRGEEPEVDPEQFQDPDNEYGLFAGTTYEQDDEEADQIYAKVDDNMDSRRRERRYICPVIAYPHIIDHVAVFIN